MSLLYHHAVDFFSVVFCPNPTSKYDYQFVQEGDDLTLGMRQEKAKARKRRLPGKKSQEQKYVQRRMQRREEINFGEKMPREDIFKCFWL